MASGARFTRELGQAFAKHATEGGKGVNDIGERRKGNAQLDCQHQLSDDLARAWRDESRADQHAASTVGDEL